MFMSLQVQLKLDDESYLLRGRTWDPKVTKGFIGVSGAYSLDLLSEHLHRRGLYKRMFESIMTLNGKPALKELSPTHCAIQLGKKLRGMLPDVLLLHGMSDKSVPYDVSCSFNDALKSSGAKCECRLYPGKSHTKPLVEDPLRGGQDILMEDIVEMVLKRKVQKWQAALIPGFLVDMASAVCPF